MKKIISAILVLMMIASLAGCSANTAGTAAKESATADEASELIKTDTFEADDYMNRLKSCVKQIKEKTDFVPDIVLVLGSGLGEFADKVNVVAEIPYSEIEGFPVSTVQGHDGKLIFCEINGKKVVVMKGRVHMYEGYDAKDVVLPLRALHLIGANTVILTHAVGAINEDYSVGDFVIDKDHISTFVPSPLTGKNLEELGERFVDMSDAYDKDLISIVEEVAVENNIPVHQGVYVQLMGPQYETPTEIRMLRGLGADTVGMSTVVETIAARHMGMRVCSISSVTNMAAGIEQKKITHEEVQESSDKSAADFAVLISGLLSKMD